MKFFVRYFDLRFVAIGIDSSFDDEPFACGGARDQVDDGLMAYERLASPVLCDEAKQGAFDLVPFTCPRREMADMELQIQVVRQMLQRHFPKSRPRTVAHTAVSRDQ